MHSPGRALQPLNSFLSLGTRCRVLCQERGHICPAFGSSTQHGAAARRSSLGLNPLHCTAATVVHTPTHRWRITVGCFHVRPCGHSSFNASVRPFIPVDVRVPLSQKERPAAGPSPSSSLQFCVSSELHTEVEAGTTLDQPLASPFSGHLAPVPGVTSLPGGEDSWCGTAATCPVSQQPQHQKRNPGQAPLG